MKIHVGVEDVTGMVCSVGTTPANEHDLHVADKLLHGEKKCVQAEVGYRGTSKRREHRDHKIRVPLLILFEQIRA